VKCFRYQPAAPGSLSLVLTRVMLRSCGTLVVVQAESVQCHSLPADDVSGLDFPALVDSKLHAALEIPSLQTFSGCCLDVPATRNRSKASIENAPNERYRINIWLVRFIRSIHRRGYRFPLLVGETARPVAPVFDWRHVWLLRHSSHETSGLIGSNRDAQHFRLVAEDKSEVRGIPVLGAQ